MDIKGVLKAVLPIDIRAKSADKTIKMDSTTDRDANGQMSQGGQQQEKEHPPMSDEQIKKAIEHLKSHAVVKEQNLTVTLLRFEEKNFVVIKDPSGKIVRKIPESELWSLQVVKDSEKGQLLRKTA